MIIPVTFLPVRGHHQRVRDYQRQSEELRCERATPDHRQLRVGWSQQRNGSHKYVSPCDTTCQAVLFQTNGTTGCDLKNQLNGYLQSLEHSTVRSLQDIIDFNVYHAIEELPPRELLMPLAGPKADTSPDHSKQDESIKAQEQTTLREEYQRHLAHLRRAAIVDGLDLIFDEYGVDVILGPADSFISTFATGSGT